MPVARYPTGVERRTFVRELGRLGDLPGVRKVGTISRLPLTGSGPLALRLR
jgi:hypothetical protein